MPNMRWPLRPRSCLVFRAAIQYQADAVRRVIDLFQLRQNLLHLIERQHVGRRDKIQLIDALQMPMV